jgi:hypothetical protein
MYWQSVRDDNQIATPVSFTHSSSLWRTQKNNPYCREAIGVTCKGSLPVAKQTLLLSVGVIVLSVVDKMHNEYTQVFVLVGVRGRLPYPNTH